MIDWHFGDSVIRMYILIYTLENIFANITRKHWRFLASYTLAFLVHVLFAALCWWRVQVYIFKIINKVYESIITSSSENGMSPDGTKLLCDTMITSDYWWVNKGVLVLTSLVVDFHFLQHKGRRIVWTVCVKANCHISTNYRSFAFNLYK